MWDHSDVRGLAPVDETMSIAHGMADIEPGLRLHYISAGQGDQRSCCCMDSGDMVGMASHHPALVNAGLRVVAPDYRGAGHSWRPPGGYDKRTMAADVYRLLCDHLLTQRPIILVGHDIGLMVAHAYAQAHCAQAKWLFSLAFCAHVQERGTPKRKSGDLFLSFGIRGVLQ
jgi:pimeloyl-ACP methyl ester carboxylesterase